MALNEKDFEPIHNLKVIERYLKFITEQKEEFNCFLKDVDFYFDGIANSFDEKKLELNLYLNTNKIAAETVRAEFNKTTERKISLSFYIQGIPFLISSKLEIAKPQEVILKLTPPLYKLQRRQSLRIKPEEKIQCLIYLPLPWEDKAITPHDISTSGFSVLVPQNIADPFERGAILKTVALQFMEQKSSTQIKLINKVRLPNDKLERWKLGFQFQNLNKTMEQEIAREAYKYNQRIWARRI